MNNLDEIFDLVGELKQKHDIYSTVTIKPHWLVEEGLYVGVSVDVYVADMLIPFNTRISTEKAVEILSGILSDPSEALKTRKEQRIDYLCRQIGNYTEELLEIRGKDYDM